VGNVDNNGEKYGARSRTQDLYISVAFILDVLSLLLLLLSSSSYELI
jgi:hypothetical protein